MDSTGVGTVCLWIWVVVFVVHGQNHYVNVATSKTYNQSSTSFGSSSNAANGNTGGTYSSTNCIHTAVNGDLSPWWEVDLGQPYPVYNIDVWARTDFQRRLYPFTITVDNQFCASATASDFPGNTRTKTVTCSTILSGQRVRITRQASSSDSIYERILNMCEMEIYVCNDGWYGQQCSNPCSPGCQNASCGRQYGLCSPCNTGYAGTKCADCEDKYYKTGLTCTSCSSFKCLNQMCDKTSGTCNVCNDGWYGQQCSYLCSHGCPNNRCDRQSGQCSPCKTGYEGTKCADCEDKYYITGRECFSCRSTCLNQVCHKIYGTCNGTKCADCENKYYKTGLTCTSCSSTCLNQVCDKTSGTCNDCEDTYFKASLTCTRCSSTCLNQRCDKTSGTCNDCEEKYYKTGLTCTSCSSDCLNQRCDQTSGTCNACIPGRYGDQCINTCAAGCLSGVCQQSGTCTPCKDGRYGDRCSMNCPQGCQNACDQRSAKCASCKDGWYRDQCTTPCPPGCLNACDQQSGKCSSCKDGLQGDNCSIPCPPGCQNASCQQSGLCSPCKTAYEGNSCSECRDRYYTNSSVCSQCSPNCRSRMCVKTTGVCDGCVDGRYGDTCSSDCQTANCQQCDQKTGAVCTQCTLFRQPPNCTEISDGGDKETINTNALIGSVLGVPLIISIVICIILVIKLKRRSVRSGENRQNNQESNDLNMSPTSPRPGAPGDKEERTTGVQAVQEQEQPYEIVEDRAKVTSDVSPKASAVSDTVYQQSEADSANPYDELTMQYCNTGDVHIYGP
ncbi:hypothetical protein ACOMHN_067141 [Nucella lapillus]